METPSTHRSTSKCTSDTKRSTKYSINIKKSLEETVELLKNERDEYFSKYTNFPVEICYNCSKKLPKSLHNMEASNNVLLTRVRKLRSDEVTLKHEIEQATREMLTMAEHNNLLKLDRKNTTESIRRERDFLNSLTVEINAIVQETKKLSENRKMELEKLEILKKQLNPIKDQNLILDLSLERKDLENKREVMESELGFMKGKIEQLEKELFRNRSLMSEKVIEAREQNRELNEILPISEKMMSDIKEARKKYKDCKKKLVKMQEKLLESRNKLVETENELKQVEEAVVETSKMRDEQQFLCSEIIELKRAIQNLQVSREEYTQRYRQLEGDVNVWETKLNDRQHELEKLKFDHQEKKSIMADFQKVIEKNDILHEQEKNRLENEIKSKKIEIDAIRNENLALQEEIENKIKYSTSDQKLKLEKLSQEIEETKLKIKNVADEKNKCEQALKDSEMEMLSSEESFTQQRDMLEKRRKNTAELQVQLENLAEAAEDMARDVARCNATLSTFYSTLTSDLKNITIDQVKEIEQTLIMTPLREHCQILLEDVYGIKDTQDLNILSEKIDKFSQDYIDEKIKNYNKCLEKKLLYHSEKWEELKNLTQVKKNEISNLIREHNCLDESISQFYNINKSMGTSNTKNLNDILTKKKEVEQQIQKEKDNLKALEDERLEMVKRKQELSDCEITLDSITAKILEVNEKNARLEVELISKQNKCKELAEKSKIYEKELKKIQSTSNSMAAEICALQAQIPEQVKEKTALIVEANQRRAIKKKTYKE